jgi:ABC-2 type transport system permease protein
MKLTQSTTMGPYLAFVRSSLLGMLAYRLRYVTGILTYLLYISIQYFIWQAVFAHSDPGAQINGYTLPEMVTYVVIAWIARSLCFSNLDWDIDEMVRSGQVSVYLLRPLSFQMLMLSQGFGEFLFRLIFFTIPILFVVLPFFEVALPATLFHGLLFVFSTFVGFVIFSQINFLIGLIAFFTKSISSLIQAKHFVLQLLSGLLLPLSFFPAWAEELLTLLPFQLITFLPMQVYLGKVSPEGFSMELWAVLLPQVVWIIALQLMGVVLWRCAADRLTVQGG